MDLARFQQQEHDSIFAAPTSNPLVLQDIELKLKLHGSNLVFLPGIIPASLFEMSMMSEKFPSDSMTKRLTLGLAQAAKQPIPCQSQSNFNMFQF